MKPVRVLIVCAIPLSLLAAGSALGADDSKVKAATTQVESGAKKIPDGVAETAKGVGNTVSEGAKYSGEKVKDAGEAAAPPAKSAWGERHDLLHDPLLEMTSAPPKGGAASARHPTPKSNSSKARRDPDLRKGSQEAINDQKQRARGLGPSPRPRPVFGPDAWAGAPTDDFREGVERVFKILRDPELKGDAKASRRWATRRQAVRADLRLRRDGETVARPALGRANTRRAGGVRSPLHRPGPALVRFPGGPVRRREDGLPGRHDRRKPGRRADGARPQRRRPDGPRLQDAPRQRPLAGVRRQHRGSQSGGELPGAIQQGHSQRVVRGPDRTAQVEWSRRPSGLASGTPVLAVTAMPEQRGALSMLSLTGRVLQSVVRLCCARPALTVVTGGGSAPRGRRRNVGRRPGRVIPTLRAQRRRSLAPRSSMGPWGGHVEFDLWPHTSAVSSSCPRSR